MSSGSLVYDEAGPHNVRHYHPGICHCCAARPTQTLHLKRCAQCHLVLYCSKYCQRKDWPTHQHLCRAYASEDDNSIFTSAKKMIHDRKSWYEFLNVLGMSARAKLDRRLEVYEKEIFLYPRVCEVCGETEASKIIDCSKCHSVFYCSDLHRSEDSEKHDRWCDSYDLCISCDTLEYKSGIESIPFPICINVEYTSLPLTIKEHLESMVEYLESDFPYEEDLLITLMSERLTYPLSLLYALQHVSIGPYNKSIDQLSELVVHVVGAESTKEMLGIICWEYLVHLLPALQKLHVVFIGPEVFSESFLEESVPDNHCLDDSGMTRCEECQEKGRVIIYEMCQMLYHTYVNTSLYTSPQAIVAYNCGFHEFEREEKYTWPESLPKMIQDRNVPLIFTSYNGVEAKKDFEALSGVSDVEVVMPRQLNPYRSLRPHRDTTREDNADVYYLNLYITSVMGKK